VPHVYGYSLEHHWVARRERQGLNVIWAANYGPIGRSHASLSQKLISPDFINEVACHATPKTSNDFTILQAQLQQARRKYIISQESIMADIAFETVTNGNIEPCRELCNELMAFQKSQAKLLPEVFDQMNFDTRMKLSYQQAIASHVAIARDGGVPIGYIFSTIENVAQKDSNIPEWAATISSGEILGFYPKWEKLPERTGCVNNLYIRKEFQGLRLGEKMMDMSMEWFKTFDDVEYVFVYISNGNDGALRFYKKHGFSHSHEVFGGFIHALCKKIR
jgi:ribosomal protein S18 acetylase RimI-like enzyme